MPTTTAEISAPSARRAILPTKCTVICATTLGYDSFHNLASIGIEGKSESLASYLYTTGGRPKSVTYANGDSVLFVYNAKGQVIEERWRSASGVETARYKYAYDGNGVAEREPSR